MNDIDPKITVLEALQYCDGNQAALGRMVGVTRASVNEWVRTDREYLPALQAHRFKAVRYGNKSQTKQAA